MRPVIPDRCCQCVQSKRDLGQFAWFRSVGLELPALARPLLPQRQSGHGTERPQCLQFWRRPVLEPWRPPGPSCRALSRDNGTTAQYKPKLVGGRPISPIEFPLDALKGNRSDSANNRVSSAALFLTSPTVGHTIGYRHGPGERSFRRECCHVEWRNQRAGWRVLSATFHTLGSWPTQ